MKNNRNHLQNYLSKASPIMIMALFMIILILPSCKNDRSVEVSSDASDFEKNYFKDYQSPFRKWGFIDQTGEFVIEPVYDDLRDFNKGIACVNYEGKWGIINSQGKIVIPFKYLDIHDFSEGLALVENFQNEIYYIDINGNKSFDCPSDECYSFHSGRARFVENGITGFIDKQGNIIEAFRFSTAGDFKDNYCAVTIGSKSGIVDTNAQIIVPIEYQSAKINEGMVRVKSQDGSYTFFDLIQKKWLSSTFTKASTFQDQYAVVSNDEGYGILDKNGHFSLFTKNKIRYLNEQRWAEKTSTGYHILDQDGNVISDTLFTNVFNYHCGVLGVEIDGSWGYIDLQGDYILEPSLPIIWDCSEDYIRFISRSGFGFFDKETKIKIAPKFYEVRDFVENLARAQQVN
jgi:hypothetical protein